MTAGMRYHSADVTDVGRYVNDDGWAMEQKLDGIRCLATVDADGNVSFTGHAGAPLRSGVKHHAALAAELSQAPGVTVDGELLANGQLWLFDLLGIAGSPVTTSPFSQRRFALEALFGLVEFGPLVNLVPSETTVDGKADLWDRVVTSGAEGVVVKRLAAGYSTTGRTRDVLKVKITRTVDVVVLGRTPDGKDSVSLGVMNDGHLLHVGKCSTIGKPPVQAGDVIEVEYLYVVDPDDPRLYQARMVRARPDKTIAECDLAQLDGSFANKAVV